MAISIAGWMNGTSSLLIFLISIAFGIYIIVKSLRYKARLLTYMGLAFIFLGLVYLINIVDFINICLTERNIGKEYVWMAIFSCLCVVFATIFVFLIASEILSPNRKEILKFIGLFPFYSLITLFLLDFDNTFEIVYPSKTGENIIEIIFIPTSPGYYIAVFLTIIMLIYFGSGFLIKSLYSSEYIKRRFQYLSFGYSIIAISTILDGIITNINIILIIRISTLLGEYIMYIGLRDEKSKEKEISLREAQLVDQPESTFSEFLSHFKRKEITEEEVIISKEKRICLVCKGKLERAMYICPDCNSFYCKKCSEALSNLENACWVCEKRFDEFKKSQPFKDDESDIEAEISEEFKKKEKD